MTLEGDIQDDIVEGDSEIVEISTECLSEEIVIVEPVLLYHALYLTLFDHTDNKIVNTIALAKPDCLYCRYFYIYRLLNRSIITQMAKYSTSVAMLINP